MRSMSKMKLICCSQSNWVQHVMKTRQDNNVIDHIGLVYVEIDIEL